MKNLIFENPLLEPLPQRIGWTFFTAIFWIFWVYLWLPLATVLLWSMGIISYSEYFERASFFKLDQLKDTLTMYGIVVLVLGGTLLLWARIEFLRFRNSNRRGIPIPVDTNDIAHYAQLELGDVAMWKAARCVVMRHDDHGKVEGANIVA